MKINIYSIDIKKKNLANPNFQTGVRREKSQEKLDKVWNEIIRYFSRGQRKISPDELAEELKLTKNEVTYHLHKLISVGAVTLR